MSIADPNIPNENLIGSICSKLYHLRKNALLEHKASIKAINNAFIGYLVTNEKTYEKCKDDK